MVEFGIALGMAVLLVSEFRLWDDLCDREQDCREDSSRVLCRAESLRPFVALLLLLAAVNFGLVAWQRFWPSLAMLLALHGFLAAWYAVRGRFHLGPVFNYQVVLLKYPAFGFVLGSGPGVTSFAPLFPSLAVVYLGLCIAEVLHDKRLRVWRSAWICLGLELLLLAGIIVVWSARTLMGGEGNS